MEIWGRIKKNPELRDNFFLFIVPQGKECIGLPSPHSRPFLLVGIFFPQIWLWVYIKKKKKRIITNTNEALWCPRNCAYLISSFQVSYSVGTILSYTVLPPFLCVFKWGKLVPCSGSQMARFGAGIWTGAVWFLGHFLIHVFMNARNVISEMYVVMISCLHPKGLSHSCSPVVVPFLALVRLSTEIACDWELNGAPWR